MGEESGEREDKVVYRERLLRGICAILFLIIFLLLLGGMIFEWRIVHSELDKESKLINMTFDFNGTQKPALNIYVNIFQQEYGPSDISRFGIISNGKIIYSCEKCEFVESVGFISDKLKIAMLGAAMVLFFINIFGVYSFYLKSQEILTITCVLGIISLLVAIIVFSCYYKDIYISHENENPMSEAQRDELKGKYDISVHDYYTSFPLPYETTFGPGFYCTLVAAVLSFIVLCVAWWLDLVNFLKERKFEKSQAA